MPHRASDNTDAEGGPRCHFRSERFFNLNGEWFFATREGEQGPFRTREEAEENLVRYLSERSELDRFQKSREVENALGLVGKVQAAELEMLPLEKEATA